MKKLLWKLIISFGVICLVGVIAMFKIYGDINETANKMNFPMEIEQSSLREERVNVKELVPFSILIVGVDEREGDRGRTDTMIVLTVNPALNSTYLFSIPRDTFTEIIGKNRKDKINHAYAFGGIEMSIKTVENFLNIPLDYVVKINMDNFINIVDVVGGIEVDNSFAFDYEGVDFPIGKLQLNGEKALKYVRMRYDDPNGDFGRQNRQKQIVEAVLKEAMTFQTILDYESILNLLEESVAINMEMNELFAIQKNYSSSLKNIEQLYLTGGSNKRMNYIYYYVADENELATIQHKLQEHLEIEE